MLRAGGVILSMLLALAVSYSPWMNLWEMRLLDAQLNVLRAYAPRTVEHDVVVVGVNEESAQFFPEPTTLWHRHFGNFLQSMASANAAAVGLDVVLPERSYDAIVPGNDRWLSTSLLIARMSYPLVLAVTVDAAGNPRPIHLPFVGAAGSGATGFALFPLDPDGLVRRFDEHIAWDGEAVDTFVGRLARLLGRETASGLIDYSVGDPFDVIPIQTVLKWHEQHDTDALEKAFSGKVVLLGSFLKFEDRLPAPVNLTGWDANAGMMPGVLLHAQTLRNLLNNGLIRPVAAWIPIMMIMVAALLFLWSPPLTPALLTLTAIWVLCVALSTMATYYGAQLPVVGTSLIASLAIGARQLWRIVLRLEERRNLRKAFGGYVSPPVMDEILSGQLQPALGGSKCFACVLFSDIRGYTSRSEHTSPEQTIAFLNHYFKRMVPLIHINGGTVVSFMGDGIMAVFGAPKSLPNACDAALRAAIAMLEDCSLLNVELSNNGEPPMRIGIGLHAGEGVAGHIGAEERHEYTFIGDVTNVASRLEGITKEVEYQLVCSRAVVKALTHPGPKLVSLGMHQLKGHSPVEVFGYEIAQPHTLG